jgi:hypothetical protein
MYECLAWAREAKTEADRKVFVDMARNWSEAASFEEARGATATMQQPNHPQ